MLETDRQRDFFAAAGTTERVINGRDGAKRQQAERERVFYTAKSKDLGATLEVFEVEKCVRKNARARILSKSYNIFFRFFFVWKRNTKQLELLRSKKLQNTHNIHKHIIREGRVAGGALLVLEESE